MHSIYITRHFLLMLVVIICAYTDIAQNKLYNAVTFPAIFAGLFLGYVIGGVFEGGLDGISLIGSLTAMLMVIVLFAWPFLRGGVAAGDIKLMLAIAAIGGLNGYFTAYALLYSTLVGAFMAIMLFIWKGRLKEGLRTTLRFAVSTGHIGNEDAGKAGALTGMTIPYGSAIAIGTVIAWFVVELGASPSAY